MVSKSEQALKWPIYKPRGWGQPSKSRPLPRPWFGLDTERDAKSGLFVCGWLAGETTHQFKGLLDLPSGTHWIWNLGYDCEGLLRDLNVPEGWAASVDGAAFPLLGGKARYFHGKRFDYQKPSGERFSLIEASSFFGRVSLSTIGQKVGIDGASMSRQKYDRDKSPFLCRLRDRREMTYREAVDWYCQEDARIVYRAVCDLDAGVRSIGVELGATPGATARRFMSRLGVFPDVIWETHKPFLKSYCGGRFEITKRGVILGTIYQYDIVSAYPWALTKCPWLTKSAVQRWTNRFSDDALYGTYLVDFDFDWYLGVAPRWKDGIRVYSKAQESTWLARPEVEWLLKRGARVRVLRGLEVFDPDATDAWARVILELFDIKQRHKKEPPGLGAKIVLNSQYGVLIQLIRVNGEWVPLNEAKNPVDWAGMLALEEPPQEFEGGKYLAPIYAGNLTSLVRVKMLDAAWAVGGEAYIAGHTDSAVTMKPLPASMCGTELGDWKLEKEAPRADVCQTGKYAIGDTVKVRGITRKGTADLLWQPTHTRKSRVGIKSAKSWDEVSVIRPKEVANNFLVERKRKWARDLTAEMVQQERWVDSEAFSHV